MGKRTHFQGYRRGDHGRAVDIEQGNNICNFMTVILERRIAQNLLFEVIWVYLAKHNFFGFESKSFFVCKKVHVNYLIAGKL